MGTGTMNGTINIEGIKKLVGKKIVFQLDTDYPVKLYIKDVKESRAMEDICMIVDTNDVYHSVRRGHRVNGMAVIGQ